MEFLNILYSRNSIIESVFCKGVVLELFQINQDLFLQILKDSVMLYSRGMRCEDYRPYPISS